MLPLPLLQFPKPLVAFWSPFLSLGCIAWLFSALFLYYSYNFFFQNVMCYGMMWAWRKQSLKSTSIGKNPVSKTLQSTEMRGHKERKLINKKLINRKIHKHTLSSWLWFTIYYNVIWLFPKLSPLWNLHNLTLDKTNSFMYLKVVKVQ